ncbi:MAG: Gfo/Idh/MocA family oxidoreductase [Planctomycetota bacterium]
MKEIRVALIGRGFMSVAHSNAFRNAGIWYDLAVKVVMKAICGSNTDGLAEFGRKFGWEGCETDWHKLAERDDIDLVSIATPNFLHRDMVIEFAKQGKDILCEKPLANSLAEAEEMCDAVKAAGVRHCCGFSYRSTPATALAKRFVDEGRIGKIFHVYARYAQDWIVDSNFAMVWRFDKKLAGSGALGDICAHIIDAARFITGSEITEVVGSLRTMIPQRPLRADDLDGPKGKATVDDVAQFLCNFDNGATGCFEATRLATGRKNHNCIEINGAKGSLYWDFEEQNYLYYFDREQPMCEQGFCKINATHNTHPYNGGPWPVGHGIGYADIFVIEVVNFLKAIAQEEDYSPNFEDGVKCQQVLDAVERSAAERRWVSL